MTTVAVSDPNGHVAAEIRAELARQQVKHTGLAHKLGVTDMWVSRRLSASVPLAIPDIYRIALVLGVDARRWLPQLDSNQQPADYPTRTATSKRHAGQKQLAASLAA